MASQKLSKGRYWDFGLGLSWYNFKLDNANYQILGTENGVSFVDRTDVNGFKSKVSASYLNVLTMYKLDFGKLNDSGKNGLRVAIGPYAGYRLGGRSKFVYREIGGSGRKKTKHLRVATSAISGMGLEAKLVLEVLLSTALMTSTHFSKSP